MSALEIQDRPSAAAEYAARPIRRPTAMSIYAGNLHQAALELCWAFDRYASPDVIREKAQAVRELSNLVEMEARRP